MKRPFRVFLLSWLLFVCCVCVAPAQQPTFKLAFWNLRGGEGSPALAGHTPVFADTKNCDPARGPVNAWGAGVVQRELEAKIKGDPAVVALGMAESYLCAPPEAVRGVLGWKAASEERNGVGLAARYGFARPLEWQQLDTSRNEEPNDTAWVVGGAVCLDPACRSTVGVYSAHWYGTGRAASGTYNIQAQQTLAFMRRVPGPHALIGDLNVFEGTGPVCHQEPNNSSLWLLRDAGYLDAWPALHRAAEGFTGMTNRKGCGGPEGYAWKRIDYAWSKGLTPVAMSRIGMVRPGDAAPSDHYGLVVEYRIGG